MSYIILLLFAYNSLFIPVRLSYVYDCCCVLYRVILCDGSVFVSGTTVYCYSIFRYVRDMLFTIHSYDFLPCSSSPFPMYVLYPSQAVVLLCSLYLYGVVVSASEKAHQLLCYMIFHSNQPLNNTYTQTNAHKYRFTSTYTNKRPSQNGSMILRKLSFVCIECESPWDTEFFFSIRSIIDSSMFWNSIHQLLMCSLVFPALKVKKFSFCLVLLCLFGFAKCIHNFISLYWGKIKNVNQTKKPYSIKRGIPRNLRLITKSALLLDSFLEVLFSFWRNEKFVCVRVSLHSCIISK